MEKVKTIQENGTKYIVKEKIGSGGQGDVYLVKKENSDKPYVIKVLKPNNNESFEREKKYFNLTII